MTESHHPTVYTEVRPWGEFSQFLMNAQATVKVISIERESRLSLQSHQLRDEFWYVLDGPVDVEVGNRTWVAAEGAVVWVPRTTLHRLGNQGPRRARVLEISFGHFDEADIERFADDFHRLTAH